MVQRRVDPTQLLVFFEPRNRQQLLNIRREDFSFCTVEPNPLTELSENLDRLVGSVAEKQIG